MTVYAPTTKRIKTHNPNRHWDPHFLLLFFLHLNPFLSFIFIFIFIFIFQTTMPLPLPSLPDDGNHHDFVAELTHRMAAFLLSDDHTFNFSPIHSHHLDSSREAIPGAAEASSQEPSREERCWRSSYDMFGKLQSFNSHQSLVQEQIRAIELSGVKQEQVAVSAKQKPAPRRKNQGQTYEPKKGNVRRARAPRPGPQHPLGAGMRALFLDGPGSRGGTGVFLPRGGAPTPSESTNNKQGKGCSTVLIPARVVQALQLHFDQMAATSGPKPGAFHPLHDVVVSNRDGMYSLQKQQSPKAAASIQNETILPQEWAY